MSFFTNRKSFLPSFNPLMANFNSLMVTDVRIYQTYSNWFTSPGADRRGGGGNGNISKQTFEKLRKKYKLCTEKLWKNVRLTIKKLQVWRNGVEIWWNLKKILRSISGKYRKSVRNVNNKQLVKNLAFIGICQRNWEIIFQKFLINFEIIL